MKRLQTRAVLTLTWATVLLLGAVAAAQGAADSDQGFTVPTDGLFPIPNDVGWLHAYVNLWWLAAFTAVSCLVLWVAKWINADCHKLAIDPVKWNFVSMAIAFTSLAAFFLIPPYVSLPASLAASVLLVWQYVPVRNRKVMPTRRLFTPEHRAVLWKKFLGVFGIKPAGVEKKIARIAKTHIPVALYFQAGTVASPAEAPPDEEDPMTHLKEVVGQAVKRHAREAELVPHAGVLSVSFRIDGIVHAGLAFERLRGSGVLAQTRHLVDLGSADPHFRAELPTLHGRFTVRTTVHGQGDAESIVLRMCPDGERNRRLTELGLAPDQMNVVKTALQEEHGLIAVAGPPEMGARTTLYAMLDSLDPFSRNIVTFERPVTGTLTTIEQNDLTKTTVALVDLLQEKIRQDYDLMMLSEVPDKATALVALTAAQRDQAVLARFELRDAVSVIEALLKLGAPASAVGTGLRVVTTQRLIRVLCTKCRMKVAASPGLLKKIGLEPSRVEFLWEESSGCDACGGTGFHGRTGIFEVWRVGEESRKLIVNGVGATELHEAARHDGMMSLQHAGLEKVLKGVTSLREVARVLKV